MNNPQTITKQLQQKIIDRKFTLNGISNSLAFSYHQSGSVNQRKGMMYLQATVDRDGLKFDAIMLRLEGNEQKKVKITPIVFQGSVDHIVKCKAKEVENIQNIEISIKSIRSTKANTFISFMISIKRKNSEKSENSINVFKVQHWQQMFDSKSQTIKVHQIKTLQKHISDFCWHPAATCTLQILLNCQLFEVWSFNDILSPNTPVQIINLNKIKKYFSIHPDTPFTAFTNHRSNFDHKNGLDNYTLYLMSSRGQIGTVFPYLPAGCIISQRQLDLIAIYSNKSKSCGKLYTYLQSCTLVPFVKNGSYDEEYYEQLCNQVRYFAIQNPPSSYEDPNKSGLWEFVDWKINEYSQKIQSKSHYLMQTDFQIINLSSSCLLSVSCQQNIRTKFSKIFLNLLPHQQQQQIINQTKYMYPLTQIQTGLKGHSKIIFISKYQQSSNCFIFFLQDNKFFKIDYSSAKLFASTNDITCLDNGDAFPLTSLVEFDPKIQLTSLMFEIRHFKLYGLVCEKSKVKFFVQNLSLFNLFEKAHGLMEISKKITSFLQQTKTKSKPSPINTYQKGQLPQKFKIQKDKAGQYLSGQFGWVFYQKDIEKFCDNLQGNIAEKIQSLRKKRQQGRNLLPKMSDLSEKKQKLRKLISQMKKNQKKIRSLTNSQNISNQIGQNKTYKNPQIDENSEKCLIMNQLLKKSQKISTIINGQSLKQINQSLSQFQIKLSEIRKKLQQAKQWKQNN